MGRGRSRRRGSATPSGTGRKTPCRLVLKVKMFPVAEDEQIQRLISKARRRRRHPDAEPATARQQGRLAELDVPPAKHLTADEAAAILAKADEIGQENTKRLRRALKRHEAFVFDDR